MQKNINPSTLNLLNNLNPNIFFTTYNGNKKEHLPLKTISKKWNFWNYNTTINYHNKNIIQIIYAHTNNTWHGCIIYSLFDNNIDIFYLYIYPKQRKKNIASALLTHTQAKLQTHLSGNIILETNVNNKAAIKLYKKFNMHEIHKRKNYYTKQQDAIIFYKTLNPK
jgi:RimJ/RimL family protein N-acetyltransferase